MRLNFCSDGQTDHNRVDKSNKAQGIVSFRSVAATNTDAMLPFHLSTGLPYIHELLCGLLPKHTL